MIYLWYCNRDGIVNACTIKVHFLNSATRCCIVAKNVGRKIFIDPSNRA